MIPYKPDALVSNILQIFSFTQTIQNTDSIQIEGNNLTLEDNILVWQITCSLESTCIFSQGL